MRKPFAALFALIVLAPSVAHAQTGCINSPESPTAVLALVGTAAIVYWMRNGTDREP